MLVVNIKLIQSRGRFALFRAFMIPSGFSSPAKPGRITSHYFLLNLSISQIRGKTQLNRSSPEEEFVRCIWYGQKQPTLFPVLFIYTNSFFLLFFLYSSQCFYMNRDFILLQGRQSNSKNNHFWMFLIVHSS